MTGLTEEQKIQIVRCLARNLHAYSVILFGSAAEQSLWKDSNVDVAFLSDSSLSSEAHELAATELSGYLNRDVMIVDFNQVHPFYKAQIVSSGVLLYDKKPLTRQYVFKRALKDYVLQNQA
ncbi:type VII toxin-antitoxin system MntA family adenylyltransferase antitoxin [Paenibacillus caui]|uniref:type VII toxin-antitoxin system MntA family adenylyltransferase antitoxin n=1 Tax=Paenibacillus caui TaxID=2873927 RepID=UPI001CA8A826|nr:nucleotidyltransferase domain-containing protein [Paenibacillus caui]